MAAEPDRYELHHEDETHVETNPSRTRVWHRRGRQPTVPAAGTDRRLTVFGSVEAFGRGRVEVLTAAQDSAAFARYLAALDARHAATGREVFLVLDNGPCHTSRASTAALAARAAWLHVVVATWLIRRSSQSASAAHQAARWYSWWSPSKMGTATIGPSVLRDPPAGSGGAGTRWPSP